MKKVSLLVTIVFILTNLIVPSVNATISNSNKTVLENKVNEDIENLNSKEDLTIEVPENLEGINPEVDEEGESKEDSTEEVPESPEGISPEIDEEGESKEDSTEEVPESPEGINPEIDEDEESKEDSIVGVPEDSEESNPGVGEDEESKDDSIVEVPKNSELDKEESNDSSDKKYKIGDAYDMIQKVEPMMYRNNILENELLNKEEYIADYEAAINREYLLNKTTSDFEIVLSHDKGGYTFFMRQTHMMKQ